MIRLIHKHKRAVYLAVIATFMAGIFVGLGSYLGSGGSDMDAIARVGDIKITTQEFYKEYNRQTDVLAQKGMTEIPANLVMTLKRQVLNDIMVRKILGETAQEYKQNTSDFEIAAIIQSMGAFNHNGQFNPEIYARTIAQVYRMQPAQFEDELRAERNASKFRNLLIASAMVTPQEVEEAYRSSGKKPGKDAAKEKAQFAQELVRMKAGSVINTYLNQYIAKHGFKDFLEQREKGA